MEEASDDYAHTGNDDDDGMDGVDGVHEVDGRIGCMRAWLHKCIGWMGVLGVSLHECMGACLGRTCDAEG